MDAARIRRHAIARWLFAVCALVALTAQSALAAPPKVGGLVPLSGAGACVTSAPTTGCATDSRLSSAHHIALGTNGNVIYVSASGPDATQGLVLAFSRDPQTGRIGPALSCWARIDPGGCSTESSLFKANYIAAGANGLGLYVTGSDGGVTNVLVPLRTDPSSGAITGVVGDCFYAPAGACGAGTSQFANGVGGIRGVTVGPNSSVYTVAHDGEPGTKAKGGIGAFARNPLTGGLSSETNCLGSAPASSFGDAGCSNSATGDLVLGQAQDVAAGPQQLYAIVDNANGNLGAVISYSVDPNSGKLLARTACFAANPVGPSGQPCNHADSLGGGSTTPAALAAAPDGSAVYVVSDPLATNSGVVTTIGLKSGGTLLSQNGCLSVPFLAGCATASGPLAQPMGVAVSPDSADVYVASATDVTHGYVTAFSRNVQTFEPLPSPLDCVSDPAAGSSCLSAPGLAGAEGIAASPDGRFVYVATEGGGLVALGRELAPSCQATSASTHTGVPVSVALSCSDPNGEPIAGGVASGAAHGSVQGSGPFVYTPAPGFTGTDSFTFKSSDGTNASGVATATITVSPPPPPPGQINPASRIIGLPGSVRAAKLTSIGGAAGPAGALRSVNVGILRLVSGAHAARSRASCLYLSSSGKLKRVSAGNGRTCTASHLLRASGTRKWTLRLHRRLPRGTYIVYSQAIALNGRRETIRLRGGANVARVKVR